MKTTFQNIIEIRYTYTIQEQLKCLLKNIIYAYDAKIDVVGHARRPLAKQ